MKVAVTSTPKQISTIFDRPYVAYNAGAATVWYSLSDQPVANGIPVKPEGVVALPGGRDWWFATESDGQTSELRYEETVK